MCLEGIFIQSKVHKIFEISYKDIELLNRYGCIGYEVLVQYKSRGVKALGFKVIYKTNLLLRIQ